MVLLWPGDASLCLSGCKFKNLFWIIQSFSKCCCIIANAIGPIGTIGTQNTGKVSERCEVSERFEVADCRMWIWGFEDITAGYENVGPGKRKLWGRLGVDTTVHLNQCFGAGC
mgnify:FL=1